MLAGKAPQRPANGFHATSKGKHMPSLRQALYGALRRLTRQIASEDSLYRELSGYVAGQPRR